MGHRLQLSHFVYFLLLACAPLCAFDLSPLILHRVDSLRQCDDEVLWIDLLTKKPRIYIISGFKTFDQPFKPMADMLLDFDHYTETFDLVSRFERLPQDQDPSRYGTYYGEARAALYRIWGLGRIDTLISDDSSYVEIRASQVEDSALVCKWEETVRGWFTIEMKGMNLVGYLMKIDSSKTRFGLVGRAESAIFIPRWLFRFLAKVAVPRVYRELEGAVERRKAAE